MNKTCPKDGKHKDHLASPLSRRVHVKGKRWTYAYGSSKHNEVCSDGMRILNPSRDHMYYVSVWDICNITEEDWFCMWDDGGFPSSIDHDAHPRITPAMVKHYIEDYLLPRKR
jgi:hypothetical protein